MLLTSIGFPVDLSKSNPDTGHIEIIDEPEVYGVYVEVDERPLFSFLIGRQGLRTEEQLRRIKPVEFDEIFQKAKAVLPGPKRLFDHR
jgi:hypothetical protein